MVIVRSSRGPAGFRAGHGARAGPGGRRRGPRAGAAAPRWPAAIRTAAATSSAQAIAEVEQPAVLQVPARADAVRERDRPAQVGEQVDGPPQDPVEVAADQAGDDHREHQVERDRAQAEPEPLVAGGERDDAGDERDADVGVEHRGQHVHGDERHGEQRDVPVQAGHCEAGQAGQAALPVDQNAEHQDGGEQQQRDDSGGAAGVPERGGPAHVTSSRRCLRASRPR